MGQEFQTIFPAQSVARKHENPASKARQPTRLQIMMRQRRRHAQFRQPLMVKRRSARESHLQTFD
jgi:hypothetical protein